MLCLKFYNCVHTSNCALGSWQQNSSQVCLSTIDDFRQMIDKIIPVQPSGLENIQNLLQITLCKKKIFTPLLLYKEGIGHTEYTATPTKAFK